MIESIIHFSIRNKVIVGMFILALIGWGTYSLVRLPIDAIPDITNNQVQVIALAPSLAVQEVESFITAPIEVAVANIPGIIELRSISRLGLSVITVVFNDDTNLYWARQQLGERLKEAEEMIPAGLAKIELAPVSSGLGEIFQYRLVVEKGLEKKYNPMELRTIQDWVVRREMLGTPGVADINSYGGFVKQYEIAVNPEESSEYWEKITQDIRESDAAEKASKELLVSSGLDFVGQQTASRILQLLTGYKTALEEVV